MLIAMRMVGMLPARSKYDSLIESKQFWKRPKKCKRKKSVIAREMAQELTEIQVISVFSARFSAFLLGQKTNW